MPVVSLQPAAVYCRISHDAEGQGLGVGRQERSCRALASGRGLVAVEVYVDNDISAFDGTYRPEYERMVDRLRQGRFSAVVTWDCDRLHRSTRELEDFIDILDVTDTALVTVTSGAVDLSSATGRMQARLRGSISRYESEHKTERVSAAHAGLADAGRWKGGPRPYGYDVYRDNYGRSLRDGRLAAIPHEAAIVEEAAARVLAGESLYRVCADLNARRVPTAQGAQWRTQTLRRVLTNPTTVGKREYKGTIVGTALWPALLAEDDWQALRDKLKRTHPDRRRSPAGASGRPRRHLLTGGIAVCGRCGTWLHTHMRPSGVCSYNCVSGPDKNGCGRVSCSARALDRLVSTAVLDRYADTAPAVPGGAPGSASANVETTPHDATDDGVGELARLFADGHITHAAWQVAQAGIAALNSPEATVHDDGEAAARAVLLAGWEQLPLLRRRARVTQLVERVIVSPTSKRGPQFDTKRVVLHWRC